MGASVDTYESERQRELARARNRRYKAAHPDRVKAYRIAHAEETKKYLRNYYQSNKSTLKAKAKIWRSENREQKAIADKNWRRNNPEKVRQYRKKWIKNNPHKAAAARKSTIQNTKPAQRARLKKWISDNYQKHRAYHRNYARTHRALFAKHERKRRALKAAAAINLKGIEQFVNAVKSKPSIACYYCGKITRTDEIHFDHIVALSVGGSHSADNLCASCAVCNQQKGNKRIDAWIRVGQQILSL